MPRKKATKSSRKKASQPTASQKLKIKKEVLKELENIKIPLPSHHRKHLPTTEELFLGALSYLWILFLIPLLRHKKTGFVDFHAKQGFVLFITSIVLFILSLFPAVAYTIAPFLWLLFFLGWLIALLHALAGRMWKVPLLGHIAARLKL